MGFDLSAYDGINTSIMVVTPEKAQQLLDSKWKNRPLSPQNVTAIYNSMITGAFRPQNGEPLIISKTGELLEGQHRLTAQVKAQKTYAYVVIAGVDRDLFWTMGSSKTRTKSDTLGAMGYLNSSRIYTLIRIKMAYDSRSISKYFNAEFSPSMEEIKAQVETLPYAEVAAITMSGWRRKKTGFGNHQRFQMFLVLQEMIAPTEGGAKFLEMMRTGLGMTEKCPAYVLSQAIQKMDAGGKRSSDPQSMFAICLKAYKAAVDGKEVTRLSWSPDREDFPYLV